MPDTIDYVGPINLGGFEIRNARIQSLASAPTNVAGRLYFDTTLQQLGVGNGTAWTYLATGAGLTQEQIEDFVGVMNSTSTVVTATYDDPTGKIVLTIGTGQITNAMVSGSAAISADKTADGTTNKVFTATEKTKLAGSAAGATANDTDANLRARSSHTGTQAASTISDLTAAVDARISSVLDPEGAPALLNSINELANALGDDPNFATTVLNQIATKAKAWSGTIGNGALTTIVVTHSLNTRKVVVSVREAGTPYAQKMVPNEATTLDTVTLYFGAAPTTGQYEVSIVAVP